MRTSATNPAVRVMIATDGIPATFIFNEAGNLIMQNNGALDYDTGEYIKLLSAK